MLKGSESLPEGLRACLWGLRGCQGGLWACQMGMRANQRDLRDCQEGLRAWGNGGMDVQMDGQNFFSFYRTLTLVWAAVQKKAQSIKWSAVPLPCYLVGGY